MDGYGSGWEVGKSYFRGQGSLSSQPFFTAPHLVNSVLQVNGFGAADGIPAQDSVAVQPKLIFSVCPPFNPRSFGEVQIARGEAVVQAKSDWAISCATARFSERAMPMSASVSR